MATRNQSRAAYDHILSNVLGQDQASPLGKAIMKQQINDMYVLMALDKDIIETLRYDDNEATSIPIPLYQKSLVLAFLHFVLFKNNALEPIGNNWTHVTQEEFDEFRIRPAYLSQRIGQSASAVQPASPSPIPRSSKPGPSLAELFKKGIKRDQTLFPTLKDEKFNDSWHRSFEIQAHAQGIAASRAAMVAVVDD
jgi:hypothetical protein